MFLPLSFHKKDESKISEDSYFNSSYPSFFDVEHGAPKV